MRWRRYIAETKNWDFAINFSPVEERRARVTENAYKFIAHPKCKQNIQVLKTAKRGEMFCPTCKEFF